MATEYRRAGHDDVAQIRDLHIRWRDDEYNCDVRDLCHDLQNWLVVADGQRVLGFLQSREFGAWNLLAGYEDRADEDWAPYLAELFIDEAHRGQGHGAQLVEAWISTLNDHYDIAIVQSEGGEDAEARSRFYQRCGFEWMTPSSHYDEPWLMFRRL